MKTIKFILILCSIIAFKGVLVSQMKYQPETIVIVLAEKNPTFDETRFPDIKFFYTPDLKLKENPLGKSSKDKKKSAWSSATGVGLTAGKEAHDSYTGKPEFLVDHSVSSGHAYIMDKNERVVGKTYNGKNEDFNSGTEFLTSFNKLQRVWETESLGAITKELIKKNKVMDPPKEKKKKKDAENKKIDIGEVMTNFEVTDSQGNSINTNKLFNNSATLLVFVYINPEFDMQQGKESGKDKKGSEYANEVAQFIAAEKQMDILYNLERGIYGNRIER